MGDVIVQCTSGTLEIDKVKGERIMISLGKGNLPYRSLFDLSIIINIYDMCRRYEIK